MHLQGNLQVVFDALYEMGIIDPVLRMDWKDANRERHLHARDLDRAVQIANRFAGSRHLLVAELEKFDEQTLSYLAMEVAREFADYHARKELH